MKYFIQIIPLNLYEYICRISNQIIYIQYNTTGKGSLRQNELFNFKVFHLFNCQIHLVNNKLNCTISLENPLGQIWSNLFSIIVNLNIFI